MKFDTVKVMMVTDHAVIRLLSLVTSTDVSPLALDPANKAVKPSLLVPSEAEKQKENFPETASSITNPMWNKSPGKAIVRNTSKFSNTRTSTVPDDSKKYNIHSAIDDFVLLRTGMKSFQNCPPSMLIRPLTSDYKLIV